MRPLKDRLKDRAWTLMSIYIRRRDRGRCFTCGDIRPWEEQNAGHFIHKDSLDYNVQNINCQCIHCNNYLSGNLGLYANNLIKKHGEKIVDELIFLGNKVKIFTIEELKTIIMILKDKIKTLDDSGEK